MQRVSKNSSLDKLSNLSIKENENLGAWIEGAEKLLWRGLRAEVVSERAIVQKILLLCDKRMEEGSVFWMRDQFENVHTLRVAKALIRELEGKARLPKLKSSSRGKSRKRREEESWWLRRESGAGSAEAKTIGEMIARFTSASIAKTGAQKAQLYRAGKE